MFVVISCQSKGHFLCHGACECCWIIQQLWAPSQVISSMYVPHKIMSNTSQTTAKVGWSIKVKEIHSKVIYQTPPMPMRRDRAIGVERWVTTFWSTQLVLLGYFTQFLVTFVSPVLLRSLIEHHWVQQASCCASLLYQGSLSSVHCLGFQNFFLYGLHGPDPK